MSKLIGSLVSYSSFLLALLSASVLHAQSVGDDPALREAAIEELESAVAQTDSQSLESLVARLSRTVPATMFEVYAARGIPADWSESKSFEKLSEEQIERIGDALVQLPSTDLLRLMEQVRDEEARTAHRAAALDLLGQVARASEVKLLLQLAVPPSVEGSGPGPSALPRAVRVALRTALEGALQRDIGAYLRVGELFGSQKAGLQSSIVDALSRVEGALALKVLIESLGKSPELEPFTLTAIARCAANHDEPLEESLLVRVRSRLAAIDGAVVQTAARACGVLRDHEAIPGLIDLLGEDHSERSAHQALKEMTGLAFRSDAQLWSDWHARELVWWSRHRPKLLRDLRTGSESEATAAVQSFAGRRIDRHALAEDLVGALERRESGLVRLVCHALGQLGSTVAVPRLIDTLEHADGRVRHAAWESLKLITGQQLPPEPAMWRGTV